ncbi:BZ3500_MvSof-1268-A1-R1_Chr3-1g05528 [Microbotryum saponariae]|uniref:BZ3500_MvSof-1268-A1-R1_Chr3-1g05528 protein n=1 Tax=Microbotryum saponariae TaxID=289078 RepID=A0A2X0N0G8_9BASI|nr:BZ3500_MvSof-1268-A1-R1_Chr3-1g05528 [Microbotryum saponariae]SDA04719.1 BZ3501_MvSof-1269-A2-R1_Chr3-1g05199 [Microbotryum saponariae]
MLSYYIPHRFLLANCAMCQRCRFSMAGAPRRQIHTAPPHQQQRLLPMVRKLVVPDAMNCNPS